jgi:hypothetical protein
LSGFSAVACLGQLGISYVKEVPEDKILLGLIKSVAYKQIHSDTRLLLFGGLSF